MILSNPHCKYEALLFKLETAIHLKLKESTVPTSMLCSWKSCKKAVHSTHELLGDHSKNISSLLKHYGTKNPSAEKFPLCHEQVQNLFNINPEAVFFKRIDTEEFSSSAKATGHAQQTSSETEDKLLEPLTVLFNPASITFLDTEIKACVSCFLSKFYFSPNDSPSENCEKRFLFHLKSPFRSPDIQIFVFPSSLLFLPVSHYFRS